METDERGVLGRAKPRDIRARMIALSPIVAVVVVAVAIAIGFAIRDAAVRQRPFISTLCIFSICAVS